MDRLPAVSPANHLAQMSWVYWGATLDSTLMTPLPPECQQRHNLVIVAGVDVQVIPAGRRNLSHLADVAAGLFHGVDVRVFGKPGQRGGGQVAAGLRLGTLYRMQGRCTASAMAV